MEARTEPGFAFRDIHCSHSDNLPALLSQLRLSVLISTYQTGHLIVVAARQGRLVLSFHQFERGHGSRRQAGDYRHLHAQGSVVRPGCSGYCGQA